MISQSSLPLLYSLEAKHKAAADIPEPPKLQQGQRAKYNPLNRQWRIYEPKPAKYRVVFHTDEKAYLETRLHNARLTQAYNAKRPAAKFQERARVAQLEIDACERTLAEIAK